MRVLLLMFYVEHVFCVGDIVINSVVIRDSSSIVPTTHRYWSALGIARFEIRVIVAAYVIVLLLS